MRQMAERVPQVLESAGSSLPEGFPARTWDAIAAGMRRHAQLFLSAAEVDAGV